MEFAKNVVEIVPSAKADKSVLSATLASGKLRMADAEKQVL